VDRNAGPSPAKGRRPVARPQTTVGGNDAYPDLWTKAAALLQSIVNNHALIDGNKRLGWLATAANSDVYDLVIDVAPRRRSIDDIATRLAHLTPS
jgi:death-on-curing protein